MPEKSPPIAAGTRIGHVHLKVADLQRALDFYAGVLGCEVGRESAAWIDFDFFGHQIVAHKVAADRLQTMPACAPV